jgi:hypothetical protein
MLRSDDVLDVKAEEWLHVLRQAAVFAATTGPFAGLPAPLGQQAAFFSQEPTSFRLQNGAEVPDTDQCLTPVTLLTSCPEAVRQ